MRATDLAPVDSKLVASLVRNVGLSDKGHLLAEIKVNICLAVYTLNLDQTDTVVLCSQTALVSQNGTVDVKFGRSGRHILWRFECDEMKGNCRGHKWRSQEKTSNG